MAVVQFWDTTGELASVRIWLRFRFGVLTETTVMMAVFWVVTPCSSLHMHWHWWCICFRHHHNFHWQLQTIKYQSLDIIMAATLHIIVFSSVTPYILVCECHRFGGPYCLQVQGWRASYKLAATYIQAARMTQTVLRLVRGRTVPVGSRFSTPSRPAPKRLPFCAKGTGSFSAGKSGRGVVLTTPHPSSAEFANRWPIGLPPLCACTGTTLGELYQLYRWSDPNLLLPWRWRQYISPKHQHVSTKQLAVWRQKAIVFIDSFELLFSNIWRRWAGGCVSGHSWIWVLY